MADKEGRIAVRLETALQEELNYLAETSGVSISDLVRNALRKMLSEDKVQLHINGVPAKLSGELVEHIKDFMEQHNVKNYTVHYDPTDVPKLSKYKRQ